MFERRERIKATHASRRERSSQSLEGIDKMEQFGEVRSILQQRPKRRSWERLMTIFEQIDDQQLGERYVPYFLDHFARSQDWYYYKREAPAAWVERLIERGECVEAMALVSHLDLGELVRAAQLDVMTLIERLLQARPLEQLRVLSLTRLNLSDDHLARLVQANNFKRLEALHLGSNTFTKLGVQQLLTAQECLPRLELLDLENTRLGPEVVDTIINHFKLPKLAWLNLQGCGLDKASSAKLEAAQTLPSTIRQGWGKW